MDFDRNIAPPEKTWSIREVYDAAVAQGYAKSLRTFQMLAVEVISLNWPAAKQLLKSAGIKQPKALKHGYSIPEIVSFVTRRLKVPTSKQAMMNIADRVFPDHTERLYTWPEVQSIIRAYEPREREGRKLPRRK